MSYVFSVKSNPANAFTPCVNTAKTPYPDIEPLVSNKVVFNVLIDIRIALLYQCSFLIQASKSMELYIDHRAKNAKESGGVDFSGGIVDFSHAPSKFGSETFSARTFTPIRFSKTITRFSLINKFPKSTENLYSYVLEYEEGIGFMIKIVSYDFLEKYCPLKY